MEHPAVSPPFYRERTFLVVASAILTGSGVVGYRALRARRQRARGPATFVTEAVLVVDLVESTRLATHYGDGLAMRARNALKDRALAIAARHGLAFSENTGDGCLMTFPSVGDAVETAIALLAGFRDRPVDLAPGPPLAVRAGIAYGEILLDARGARHGAVINKAFRLEGLGRDSLAPMGEEEGGREFPERDRIFLDEEAARELPAGMSQRVVGFTSLKGFSGLHRVYEVPSDPRS
jgi:class 3 adenylate cyclase